MGSRPSGAWVLALVTALVLGVSQNASAANVSVGSGPAGPVIPSGFVGLSTEFGALLDYTGTNPTAINPVFIRLIQNLTPFQQPALRIGGDSSDRTWWPVRGIAKPAGVNYTLTPNWLAVTRALGVDLRARITLGVNLEADNTRLASVEAGELVDGVGPSVRALEIGNEPEYYATRWYSKPNGQNVPGRPPGYDVAAYNSDYARFVTVMPKVALAAPATGSPAWTADVPTLKALAPRLALATVHRYALNRCVTDPSNPAYPTLAHLMALGASRGLVSGLAADAFVAHAHKLTFRIDELNAVTCQGRNGVSNTFGSALWLLDTLFAAARTGVNGVNIHVWPGAKPNELFTFSHPGGRWLGAVRPNYYGALLFTQAAPAGSTLIAATVSGGHGQLRTWATRDSSGHTRIIVINTGARAQTVVVHLTARATAPAAVEVLHAPGLAAEGRVTLGGRSFGATATGVLPAPVPVSARPRRGAYRLTVGQASATLLTVP